jgi:hypothetical protein
MQVTTALVCEAEDKELDVQLLQLFQAVQVRLYHVYCQLQQWLNAHHTSKCTATMQEAKHSRMELETEKMRLQKEMMELQLLLNADDQADSEDNRYNLNDGDCESETSDSPKIPAVKQFQLEESLLINSEHV